MRCCGKIKVWRELNGFLGCQEGKEIEGVKKYQAKQMRKKSKSKPGT